MDSLAGRSAYLVKDSGAGHESWMPYGERRRERENRDGTGCDEGKRGTNDRNMMRRAISGLDVSEDAGVRRWCRAGGTFSSKVVAKWQVGGGRGGGSGAEHSTARHYGPVVRWRQADSYVVPARRPGTVSTYFCPLPLAVDRCAMPRPALPCPTSGTARSRRQLL